MIVIIAYTKCKKVSTLHLGSAVINNRNGLTLPDSLLEKFEWRKGDAINFFYHNNFIVIERQAPPTKPNGEKINEKI